MIFFAKIIDRYFKNVDPHQYFIFPSIFAFKDEQVAMKHLNTYMSKADYSLFRTFCQDNGERKEFKKKDFFLRKGERAYFLGCIQSGFVRYSCTGSDGNIHVVGYSFEEDFAVDYASFLDRGSAVLDIQVMETCQMDVISFEQFSDFINQDLETQKLGRRMSEELFITMYERLLDFYLYTPEERYLKLMEKFPFLIERVSMKEVASFIGISAEALSRMRKRLLYA